MVQRRQIVFALVGLALAGASLRAEAQPAATLPQASAHAPADIAQLQTADPDASPLPAGGDPAVAADDDQLERLARRLAANPSEAVEAGAVATTATDAAAGVAAPGASSSNEARRSDTSAGAAPSSEGQGSPSALLPPGDPREQLPLRRSARQGEGPDGDAEASAGGGWVFSTLLSLALVLGLIFLLRGAVAKFTGRPAATSASAAIEVLTRVAVAPKNHVLLVRLGQRVLVLGDSSAGLTTLANLDDPEEVAALLQSVTASRPESISRGFAQLMSRFGQQYDQPFTAQEGLDGGEHRVDRARNEVSGLLSRLRTLAGKGGGDA